MFDYPAEGTPNSFGGARRPASPADPVPPVKRHDLQGGQRRPRSKQTAAGAKHPRLNSEGAASFADRCAGQSGGAGSGGKPDKAGANCEMR